MAFYTHTPGALLITDLADGGIELLDAVPTEAESGWDTLRETLLIRASSIANIIDLLRDATFNSFYGRGVSRAGEEGSHFLFVTHRTPKQKAPGLYIVDVTSQGLLCPRGYKITYDGIVQQQTVSPGTFPDPDDVLTLFPKVSAKETNVTATIEYGLWSTGEPTDTDFLTAYVGQPQDLPAGLTPSVPDSIWGFLSDPTYHYPNGWVLEAVTMENLAGLTNVFWVKEKFVHQRPYTA